MTATGQVIGAAAAFIWLGMVSAISFLETPLKFRAPGISLPLGLGIGRLVFRALNATEITLAAVLLAALLAYRPGVASWVLLGISGALLATQTWLLRPRLDRRAGQIITGSSPPPSRLHLAYIALEILKIGMLAALGTLLIVGP
ncbi:MAG: hypothetical protein ABJD68_16645 [Nakamurella sp.]